jgi:hypothetical protein
MHVRRVRKTMFGCAVALVAACSNHSSEPVTTKPNHTIVMTSQSGNGQTGLVNTMLSAPLVVSIIQSDDTPISGTPVTFAVTSGSATVSPTTTTTDANGQAKTLVTFGATPGVVRITATATALSQSTTFVVAAGTGAISSACASGGGQIPAVGGVVTDITATGICLSGGTGGAEYALVAFNSSPDSELVATGFTVKGTNTAPVTTADVAPVSSMLAPSALLAPSSANLSALRLEAHDIRSAFDQKLRLMAQRQLAALIPDARAAFQRSSFAPSARASGNMIPTSLSVGQTITLNANGDDPCTNPINIRARVAAISSAAIVVADTANPAGGFTDAEYASFATTFDTLVNPLDVNAFGQPSDIDKNGKVLILFTKQVNKMTPRGSAGFIGGFFFERDLFPTSDTQNLQGCATSNQGEMFYLLVPDPNAIYSDRRTKADVLNNTIGTLAHEYQHLINAGRRMYVNNADQFESVWLNEGLSHIAEELLYYRATNHAPRQNLGAAQIGSDTAAVRKFNEFQSDNLGRYQLFLGKPTRTDVYADNDSLETRGATWNMLRYLADHRGSADGDVWMQLVNTNRTGHQNLANVFGATYMTSIRDWATSVFSDDLAGVTNGAYLEPSWNMRDIFPRLCSNDACTSTLGRFPLSVIPLGTTAVSASVVPGGAGYFRFTVPANAQASVDWSTGNLPVSPLVQFTVVRTK